jgi:hypothetical protein
MTTDSFNAARRVARATRPGLLRRYPSAVGAAGPAAASLMLPARAARGDFTAE